MSLSNKNQKKNILIGLTGSIAAYKTCTLISRLKQMGHDCRVIATHSALKFVGEATLEGLTGEEIHQDTFASGQMMSHIDLARWADLFVVAPLTASHLNKMASGFADNILTTTYLAYEPHKPFFIAPAMNTVMLNHPTVVESLKKLEARGTHILQPHAGLLACGEKGDGKMMEPEDILQELVPHLTNITVEKPLNVLVTYGGTRETIDGVRFISNLSTGKTGAELVRRLKSFNHVVDVIRAHESSPSPTADNTLFFESHGDLEHELYKRVAQKPYDLIIQMAAVSDFGVDRIQGDGFELAPSKDMKIPSSKNFSIQLKQNKKIVNQIKEHSQNKNAMVIAFKLTNTRSPEEREAAVQKLLQSTGVDAVVHNDLHDIHMREKRHPFTFYKKDMPPQNLDGVFDLARQINLLPVKVNHGPLP